MIVCVNKINMPAFLFVLFSSFYTCPMSYSDTFHFHEEPIRACPWGNVGRAPVNRTGSMKKYILTYAEVCPFLSCHEPSTGYDFIKGINPVVPMLILSQFHVFVWVTTTSEVLTFAHVYSSRWFSVSAAFPLQLFNRFVFNFTVCMSCGFE